MSVSLKIFITEVIIDLTKKPSFVKGLSCVASGWYVVAGHGFVGSDVDGSGFGGSGIGGSGIGGSGVGRSGVGGSGVGGSGVLMSGSGVVGADCSRELRHMRVRHVVRDLYALVSCEWIYDCRVQRFEFVNVGRRKIDEVM